MQKEETINIYGARENNLQDVYVEIPKKQITVFTGVSGSGKSSLCLDTIAAVSRRELNETFSSYVQHYLPRYGRPVVDRIENLPVCILIDQKKPGAGNRSTVGTYTDIYALLRLLFSRVGSPFVGYSDAFSFNHPSGKCPRCDGIGEVTDLDVHKLVDFDKCLNDEDVIHFPTFTTGAWRWKRYAYSGLFDLEKKIRDYTPQELELFLHSPQIRLKNPPANWPAAAKYEGIIPRMYRSIIQTKEAARHQKQLDSMISTFVCPQCEGTRVNEKIRSCKINGRSIADVVRLSIREAYDFIEEIQAPLAVDIRDDLLRRLGALMEIGLSYLTLGRATSTLSGGEAQRIKIAKYINSALSDIVYVLDEPSVGLHPKDITRLKRSLLRLRDHGNTILIVEHHREIIAMADHIIDMGPLAGSRGGQIMYEGDVAGLTASDTVTGRMLRRRSDFKPAEQVRRPTGYFRIERANLNNLRDLSVDIPMGVLTVVAGVAGSGKSSLMETLCSRFDPVKIRPAAGPSTEGPSGTVQDGTGSRSAAVTAADDPSNTVQDGTGFRSAAVTAADDPSNTVQDGTGSRSAAVTAADDSSGHVQKWADSRMFPQDLVFIGQKNIGISLRSTPATYLEIADPIRKLFSENCHVAMKKFSFNSEGACPACGGKGVIVSEMAFMDDIESVCDVCQGKRYNKEALSYRFRGKNIAEIMEMSVEEAIAFFREDPEAASFLPRLVSMQRVGLGYLHLDQAMSTLSGGELQRVKLASQLWRTNALFVLDEPTDGLHLDDIRRLMLLFHEMTDSGNTLILIEHSTEVMKEADYIIELGPEGGHGGGRLLFAGAPRKILSCPGSVTREYLR